MEINIVDYSEKAIAVIGDTKAIKDSLKKLGGKFNPRLSCGVGWIFSAKKRAEVEKVLNIKANRLPVPAVYCGTYAKYNSGSIAGEWVKITDFKTGEDVLKYCINLHKDEQDPELMFQDFENFPDQFYGESMGAAEFDEILKWYAEETKKAAKPIKNIKNQGFDDCKAEFIEGCSEFYKSLYKTELFAVVKIGEFFAKIEKSKIETRFPVGEGIYRTMQEADKICDYCKTKEGFFSKNLEKKSKFEKNLKEKKIFAVFFESDSEKNERKVVDIVFAENIICLTNKPYYRDKKIIELSQEQKKQYIAAYNAETENFKKRLETWWKRYGAEHVHTWTYWMDR